MTRHTGAPGVSGGCPAKVLGPFCCDVVNKVFRPPLPSSGQMFSHHFEIYRSFVLDIVITPGADTVQKSIHINEEGTKKIYSQNKFATPAKSQR